MTDTKTMQIVASDVQDDDVWQGDGTTLHILKSSTMPSQKFIPWGKSKNEIPVPMRPIKIFGVLYREGESGWASEWILQPDMPMIVTRKAQ